ncbi:hypothetical protein LCGC14_1056570 [marine sediment metagenome]|uniref:Uncharacterized protein n=1 Tax=marine sediment metagenome TaxID=412755 RepID=A0A0F9QTC2_9ZZZZ
MGFWDNLKEEWAEKARIKKEEEEMIRRLKIEAEVEKKRIFEEEFRKNIFKIAQGKAKKEAAEKSGLQKLRAMNRVKNLEILEKNPSGFLGKLSEYTQRNIAKREENMKRTAEVKKTLEEEKMKKTNNINKPFQRQSYFG